MLVYSSSARINTFFYHLLAPPGADVNNHPQHLGADVHIEVGF